MSHYQPKRSTANIMFKVIVGLQIMIALCVVVLLYNVVTDPASVGEFFGKIVKGFNEVQ